jgi:hypothetical protein
MLLLLRVDEFWEHISSTYEADPYRHEERLVQQLSRLPPETILDFDYHWVQARNQAYTAKLWAAATLIDGSWVSDDRFDYFIDWLILRGRDTFETVAADPDSLDGIVGKGEQRDPSYEGYPARDAWMAAIESTDDPGGWDAFVSEAKARHGEYRRLPDLDEQLWVDDDEQLRRRLPSLAARFLEPRSPPA